MKTLNLVKIINYTNSISSQLTVKSLVKQLSTLLNNLNLQEKL